MRVCVCEGVYARGGRVRGGKGRDEGVRVWGCVRARACVWGVCEGEDNTCKV